MPLCVNAGSKRGQATHAVPIVPGSYACMYTFKVQHAYPTLMLLLTPICCQHLLGRERRDMLPMLSTRAPCHLASQQVRTLFTAVKSCMTWTSDRFGGVTIDEHSIPSCPTQFETQLCLSMADWKTTGVTAAWLRVPVNKTVCLPAAVGFRSYIFCIGDFFLIDRFDAPSD